VTKKHDQRDLGSTRLTTASRARSPGPSLGRVLWQRKHGELMPQDEDLKVLGSVTASEQREQLDGAAQREVGEFGQHQGRRPLHSPRGHTSTLSSERGGRSSGRLSGTLRQPPSSESHQRRPLLVPPRSHAPYPVVPVTNLTAGAGASKVGPIATTARSADHARASSR
jgi:hypothetical protein